MNLTTTEVISIAFGMSTIGFTVVGWGFNRLLNQRKDFTAEKKELHRELEAQKEKAEESVLTNIGEKIEGLLVQVTSLFSGQREINADISAVKEGMGTVEKRMGELHQRMSKNDVRVTDIEKKMSGHHVRCNEREKVVLDLKSKQDKGLEKLNSMVLVNRKNEPDVLNRCDREN